MMASRPRTRGLAAQVAQSLGGRIVQGRLCQGAKIANEDRLSAEFGVSRTVIREAMSQLGAKGLVEIRPRLGSRVRPRGAWSLLDPDILSWQRAAEPPVEILLQLREMRAIVEPPAAALAAARCDDSELEGITQAYRRMETGVADREAFATADAEFHSSILRAVHNDYLDALVALIATDLTWSIKLTNPDRAANLESLTVHADVATAIERRDPDAAETAMRVLLEDAARRLKQAIETSRHA